VARYIPFDNRMQMRLINFKHHPKPHFREWPYQIEKNICLRVLPSMVLREPACSSFLLASVTIASLFSFELFPNLLLQLPVATLCPASSLKSGQAMASAGQPEHVDQLPTRRIYAALP